MLLKVSKFIEVSTPFYSSKENDYHQIIFSFRSRKAIKVFQTLWEYLDNAQFDSIPIHIMDKLIELEILVSSQENELDVILLESQICSASFQLENKFNQIDFCNYGEELTISIDQEILIELIEQNKFREVIGRHKATRLSLNLSQLNILEKISLESRLKISIFLDCRELNSNVILEMFENLIHSFIYTNTTIVFYLNTSLIEIETIISLVNSQERWRIIWSEISVNKTVQNKYFESFLLSMNNTGYYWKSDNYINNTDCIDGYIFKKNTKRVPFDSSIKKKLSENEILCSNCKFLPVCGGHEMKQAENDDFCPSFVNYFDKAILALYA